MIYRIPDVAYRIGETVETVDRKYTCIGYEVIPDRGLRYILLYLDNGKADWQYMYGFEIEALTGSSHSCRKISP